jgi:hypothetical protein
MKVYKKGNVTSAGHGLRRYKQPLPEAQRHAAGPVQMYKGTSLVGRGAAAHAARIQSLAPPYARQAVIQLQRMFGNRYTAGVLRCVRQKIDSPVMQPTLTVGPAYDKYEAEADRLSAQVMRQAQNRMEGAGAAAAEGSIEGVVERARDGGQPLPPRVRRSMEQALKADFGDVRVHTDSRADALNRELKANAFTSGRDIFFRTGQYAPHTAAGRQLLSHELVHVIQQRAGIKIPGENLSEGLQAMPQATRTAQEPGAYIQCAKVKPVLTPSGGKAAKATLTLQAGDTPDTGGKPTVVPKGWNELKALGLTRGRDNWHIWVRFHMINEDQGGPDDVDNLIPTTQRANHDDDWLKFEKKLDDAAKDPNERPLECTISATYYNPREVEWTRTIGRNKKSITTQSEDYPKMVRAELKVNGVQKAFILQTELEGLIRPEDLKSVPKATSRVEKGKTTQLIGSYGK